MAPKSESQCASVQCFVLLEGPVEVSIPELPCQSNNQDNCVAGKRQAILTKPQMCICVRARVCQHNNANLGRKPRHSRGQNFPVLKWRQQRDANDKMRHAAAEELGAIKPRPNWLSAEVTITPHQNASQVSCRLASLQSRHLALHFAVQFGACMVQKKNTCRCQTDGKGSTQ